MPCFSKALLGESADFLVFHRQHPIEHFDDGNGGAHVEDRSEANSMPMAPDPTTNSDFGMAGRHHRLAVGPDQFAVGFEARELPRAGPGGQDDVRGRDLKVASGLPSFGGGDCHACWLASEACRCTVEHLDLVLLHQMGRRPMPVAWRPPRDRLTTFLQIEA